MEPFGIRLRHAMDTRGQLCVGIDPHASLLAGWGLDDSPSGLERFAMTVVEALASTSPCSSRSRRSSSGTARAGIAVLEQVVRAAREAGALVLLDAKRGDIGSTMQGYAEAYLDQSSPVAVDAMTVSPYLGFESLRPALDTAAAHGAGLFVLALTSNPEGLQVQHARATTGTVAGEMLAAIAQENAGAAPLGSVGAVVGANLASCDEDLAVNGPLLAPGFGVQGGGPNDVRRIFAAALPNVLASTSREVLSAGPDVSGLREAAARSRDVVAAAVGSGS